MLCELCLKPFHPATPTSTVCVQCLLHPKRKAREDIMPVHQTAPTPYVERFADKICTVCEEKYTPTGGNQTKCPACRERKSPAELRAGIPDHAVLTTNIDQIKERHALHDACREILDSATGVLSVTLTYEDLVVTISEVKEYS